jgi:hypothetical protein
MLNWVMGSFTEGSASYLHVAACTGRQSQKKHQGRHGANNDSAQQGNDQVLTNKSDKVLDMLSVGRNQGIDNDQGEVIRQHMNAAQGEDMQHDLCGEDSRNWNTAILSHETSNQNVCIGSNPISSPHDGWKQETPYKTFSFPRHENRQGAMQTPMRNSSGQDDSQATTPGNVTAPDYIRNPTGNNQV